LPALAVPQHTALGSSSGFKS